MSSQTTQQALPTSTGMFGAVWAQAELRKVLSATGARVAEVELAMGHAHEHLDPDGHPTDPTHQEALHDSVRVLFRELADAQATRPLLGSPLPRMPVLQAVV